MLVESERMLRRLALVLLTAAVLAGSVSSAVAEPPDTAYIFPAGAQRGTTVPVRIGGYYLHEGADFIIHGAGVTGSPRVELTERIWFEGPVIPLPDSQRKEDYPRDYLGTITVAQDASAETARWRVKTSQGLTAARTFVIGDLPERVEEEIDGRPLPVPVEIPVTVNGRIFPREDIDIWTVRLTAGQTVTCAVTAQEIGSPLDSRLEVRGPDGRRLAENDDFNGADSLLQFTAPADGAYQIQIHDVNFGGLQDYVYRLTITDGPWVTGVYPLGGRRGTELPLQLQGANLGDGPVTVALPEDAKETAQQTLQIGGRTTNPVTLAVDDLPEHLEEQTDSAAAVSLPAVLNGRIQQPGETDTWTFHSVKGEQWVFAVQAAQLGSPLDSVITVLDAAGEELASDDDTPAGQTDSKLTFSVPADGEYRLHIRDQLPSRGGPQFAYRVRIAAPPAVATEPDFEIVFPTDTIQLERGGSTKLKVKAQRGKGLDGEIELQFANLPAGVTVNNAVIPKGKNETDLEVVAADSAAIALTEMTMTARAVVETKTKTDGQEETVEQREIVRTVVPADAGPDTEAVTLYVTAPTLFKFTGVFESKYAPRGSVFVRHYTIDRGGFTGPIEISLADKQVRHLQGVTGPTIVVPPESSEFDYPAVLSPWLEVGRTSRTTLMAVGVLEEPDGSRHKVTYTSQAQNDQIIILTDPNRLSVSSTMTSVAAAPAGEVRVPVTVGRGPGLSGPVTVELSVARHMQGVSAEAVMIPAEATEGELTLRFAADEMGPFNMPVTLRATLADERGLPVTCETPLVIVGGR